MPAWVRSEAFLATKFTLPRRRETLVIRRRLLDAIDAGMQGAITLLAAPAGAGKSALVSSWIEDGRSPGPVAWFSLDADDADRRRFWGGVLEALAKATADEAVASLPVSTREPMEIDTALGALVDALAGRDTPVVLVLDDFHEVADVMHEDLERLVRFPPPALRLIMVTRSDLAIALGRLRLDGSLTEIRGADLAFTIDETAAMFAALEVELAPADLERLWQRTEGWAAALRLAATSLRDHPDQRAFVERFAGTDVTMGEYLVSEVLSRQPPDLREFLRRTSVVDTFNEELANALTGGNDGHAMIARLEHDGVLTTPLDDHGIWHRYHPLFAELLRAEMRAQLPEEVEGLHRRAATWLGDHGQDGAALRHAAAGGGWDLAADLVAARWVHLLMEGEMEALRAVIDSMPDERIGASPELALAFGAALLARGDHAAAAPYVRMACNHARCVPTQGRAQFTASLVAVRLHESLRGTDPRGALEAARELLGHDAVLESEGVDCALRAFVLSQLGVVELWTGELDAATEHLERAMGTSLAAGTDWTTLTASAHLAALAIAQGRHEDAETLLDGAADALRDARHLPLGALHALLRALLVADAEEPEAALSVVQAARDELGDWPLLPQLEKQLVAHEALLRATVLKRQAGGPMLGREPRRPAVMTAERLSEREQAILRYLPTMMSNQEIAGELYVSINTVKTHLKSIYRKLDATGRRDAVLRGRELGLMP